LSGLLTSWSRGQAPRWRRLQSSGWSAWRGFGAGDSRGRGGFLYSAAFHLLLGRVYDDKDVQERIVRRSKLDWVIVRPVILTNGPKTNAYRALVDPRGWTCGFISRADVADFLVKQIDDDAFLHKTKDAA
jgi:uncharacterized protein YbjT (DUF2867 family)